MRIGVDIDNVISNFDDAMIAAYLEHDKKLRGMGVVNPDALGFRKGMFDWSAEEEEAFYKGNIDSIVRRLGVIEGAKECLDRLRGDGHSIYIITARDNGDYPKPHRMTEEWLAEKEIVYDKLILTPMARDRTKTPECLELGIDVMLDDTVRICEDCIEHGVPAILMDTRFNRHSGLQRVSSWEEFYEYVCSLAE